MDISTIFQYGQLAQASYSALDSSMNGRRQSYIDALTDEGGAGMAGRQAQAFTDVYEIVDQRQNTANGFSATVFQQGDEFILAIRGTENGIVNGSIDWSGNFGDVGRNGIAIAQAIDLFNYFQDLTARQGAVVYHYSYNQGTNEVTYTSNIAEQNGLLFGHDVAVTGHSLGGHLALIMSRLAPDRVTAAYTYNAPGFDTTALGGATPGSQAFFDALRQAQITAAGTSNIANSFDLSKITNVAVPEDVVHLIGNVPGGFLLQFSEGENALTGHRILGMVDSLATYDLLQTLARSESTSETLIAGIDIFKAASNSAASSLEAAVNAMGELFKTGTTVASGDREQLYKRVADLRSFLLDAQTGDLRSEFQGLSLANLVNMRASDLAAQAMSNVGYRYALTALNPFAVLGRDSVYKDPLRQDVPAHNLNGSLDLFNAETRNGSLTAEYIADRSSFLAAKSAGNLIDAGGIFLLSQTDNWRYVDLPREYEVTAFGSAPVSSRRYAIFGGDGADRLEGSSQADRLYGGAGTDYVIGHAGNDYQEGGGGLDLYRFNAGQRLTFSGLVLENDGADEILDVDGLGLLRYVYRPLLGSAESAVIVDTSDRVSDTTWRSADGKFTYAKQGADLLVGINVNGGGSLTLHDFHDGDFGIHLWSGRPDPTTARTLEGDRKPEDADPNQAGDQLAYDNWGNVVTTDELAQDRDDGLFGRDDDIGDLIVAGGGNDILFGDTPMMVDPGPRTGFDPLQSGGGDWLQGDSGRDFIDGGPGNDLVEGGFGGVAGTDPGGDVIQGGLGDDRLYGDFRIEIGAAIRNGETDAASSLKGDFISGGAGEDWLIGSTSDDVLMGGGGKDVLVGGAGDDVIRGDDGQGATTLTWTVTRIRPPQSGPNVYELDFTGTNFFDFSEGGADVIYGGAGEDWVLAEAGDDFVNGGSGDDVLFGGFGSDIILGGAGNDVIIGDEGGPADAAEGGDYLDGGDGDDKIYGNGGDDIIVGGRGNDVLVGGAGKDVYVYEKGDGRDTIDDSDTAGSAASVIQFGPGLARDDVKFGVGSLKIYFGSGDGIHVEGVDQLNPSSTPLISELRFDDGEVMTYADILAQGFDIEGTPEADLMTGTGVVDRMRGFEGNDVLAGLDGDDYLYGGGGSDTLDGGTGNDYLEGGEGFDALRGGAGDDTYVYDTFDVISDTEGVNPIVFGTGIAPENLVMSSLSVSGQPRLLIAHPGESGPGLEIRGAALTTPNFVYAFADGRTLSQAELAQASYYVAQNLYGGGGDDTLVGFAGNDNLFGGEGNDTLVGNDGNDALTGYSGHDVLYGGAGDDNLSGGTGSDLLYGGPGRDFLDGGPGADAYFFGYGDGQDTVYESGTDSAADAVRLADGISLPDVSIEHEASGDLVLTLNGTQDRLVVDGWYTSPSSRVERIVFGDGKALEEPDLAAIPVLPIAGTLGNDQLTGTAYGDTLLGLEGDDTLDGGLGDDILAGGEGADSYVLGWGAGIDSVIDQDGETSTVLLAPSMTLDDVLGARSGDDLFLHIRRTEHGLLLKDYYTQAHDWQIQTYDGTPQPLADFLGQPAFTTGNEVLDLWQAKLTEYRSEFYGWGGSWRVLPDGRIYKQDLDISTSFSRYYYNGDIFGSGSSGSFPYIGSQDEYRALGPVVSVSSDAPSQFWPGAGATYGGYSARATYVVNWDPVQVTTRTYYQGTYVGADLVIRPLYWTQFQGYASGDIEGIDIGSTAGATSEELFLAAFQGRPLPNVVNGEYSVYTQTLFFDEVHAGPSSNVIEFDGNGFLDGGASDDLLDASMAPSGSGRVLYGGAGNDRVTGSGGPDLLIGGGGSDLLAGRSGDDTYYFMAADAGMDVVNEVTPTIFETVNAANGGVPRISESDWDSADTIEFGRGLTLDALSLSWGIIDSSYSRSFAGPYETLDISWSPGNGVRVLLPYLSDWVLQDMAEDPGESWGVEYFKFADGTLLTTDEMASRVPVTVLDGTRDDDYLQGTWGRDVLAGGAGSDYLEGGAGDDTYRFNAGDGEDWIDDVLGSDTVVFGTGIRPEMIALGLGSLRLQIGSTGDVLHIERFDPDDALGSGAIETYQFDNGVSLTHAELLARGFDIFGTASGETLSGTGVQDRILGFGGDDTLAGGAGDDALDGGAGNDILLGGEGSDVYVFGIGSGQDAVEETDAQGDDVDALALGASITPENLLPSRFAQDLILRIDGASDSLTVRRWYDGAPHQIEEIRFDGGPTWDAETIARFLPPPEPPVLVNPIVDQTAAEDAQFLFSLPADTFADPDASGSLTYTALRTDGTALPGWLRFDPSTRSFSGRPTQADVGALDVRVVATDSDGLSAEDVFTLTVLNTNDAPVLANAIPDQAATEETLFTFTLAENTFFDEDPGDILTLKAQRYDATSSGGSLPPPPPPGGSLLPPPPPPPPGDSGSLLPAWLYFDAATRTFSGTPTNDDVGAVQIKVTASDAAGASVSDVFQINVVNANRPPVVQSPIADQVATEDAPFVFTVPSNAITDPDAGDILTWSAEGANGEPLPQWLSFDPVSLAFSGTPTNDDVGSFGVRVTATDRSNAPVSDVFGITVANSNDAPTLSQPIADQSATEDQVFELAVPSETFADVDAGDSSTLSASLAGGSPLPAWLAFNGSIFSGTPLNDDVGAYDIELKATDAAGASATDVFHLDVANVNDAPVVAHEFADQSFEAGSAFTFSLPADTFAEEDAGDSLTLSASLFGGGALPAWLSFDPSTATFSGNTDKKQNGISQVLVTATDGVGASVPDDFGLVIRAPAGSAVSASKGDDLIFGGTGNETLTAKGGDDAIFAGAGDDLLKGGTGNDVLQGGDGEDTLHAGSGQNLLDGGAGDDLIFAGKGSSLIVGGAGNDVIRTGMDNDVILFNRGDGFDTVIADHRGDNTLSFGGGIGYGDLTLSRSGQDLVVGAGGDDGVLLGNWYSGKTSVLNLQIVSDALADFDGRHAVQTFDFLGLVSAYDNARRASPGLTSWHVTNALLQFHLWGADDAALGGDLAYWYGKNRMLAGISLAAAQQVIGASGFGSDAQSLHPFSGLQEGFVKLS